MMKIIKKIVYTGIIALIMFISLIFTKFITSIIMYPTSTANDSRLVEVGEKRDFKIYYDKVTKVMYLQSERSSGYQGYGGLTVMLDKDGKPLLWGNDL